MLFAVESRSFDLASINTTSVREEIDRLRGEFNRLRAEGNVPPEIDILVNSLLVYLPLCSQYSWSKPQRRIVEIQVNHLPKQIRTIAPRLHPAVRVAGRRRAMIDSLTGDLQKGF